MLFKCLKRMIEKGNYESKEAMAKSCSSVILAVCATVSTNGIE